MTDEALLYIVGMPKEEFGAELIRQKLENVLENLSFYLPNTSSFTIFSSF